MKYYSLIYIQFVVLIIYDLLFSTLLLYKIYFNEEWS